MAGFSQQSEDALRALADRLVDSLGERDPEQSHRIRGLVSTEAARFDEAKVRAFVPILVERAVRHRLDIAPGPQG
jgi:hypothetical protein